MEAIVWGAVERTLGVDRRKLGAGKQWTFSSLGGDSVSALRFVDDLERQLQGLKLPVSTVLSPIASIDSLVQTVTERLQAKPSEEEQRSSTSPARSDVIKASDLSLDRFFSQEEMEAAKSMNTSQALPEQVHGYPRRLDNAIA